MFCITASRPFDPGRRTGGSPPANLRAAQALSLTIDELARKLGDYGLSGGQAAAT